MSIVRAPTLLRCTPKAPNARHLLWVNPSRLSSNAASPGPASAKPGRRNPHLQNESSLPANHRAIAVQHKLYMNSHSSPGAPLFLPNGAIVFNELISFLRAQYKRFGLQEVITPTIYKKSLWEQSGHWENYKDDMFEVRGRGVSGKQEDVQIGEEEEYGVKPMNCPGHCIIYGCHRHSYRDLPLRYADFSPLHRNEVSGSLSGLTRVRRFHQDDGHIFCRPSQIADEISSTLDFVSLVYETLKLPPYRLVLSTRPEKDFIGTVKEWDQAEEALKQSLDKSQREWTTSDGDGAFYGPKIDIILEDAHGKEHQTATIQLDFQLPQRFGLKYDVPLNEAKEKGDIIHGPQPDPEKQLATPVMIHRAVFGSLERFMAILIEHYNRRWPFWLAPRQAVILTIGKSSPELSRYVHEMADTVRGFKTTSSPGQGELVPQPRDIPTFNVDVDNTDRHLDKKVSAAKQQGYNVILAIGPRDMAKGTASVDVRGQRYLEWSKGLLRQMVQENVVGEGNAVPLTAEQVYTYFCCLAAQYR